jgi:hypothetical protein
MWDPGDHPHPHFAITGCMGDCILRSFGERPPRLLGERLPELHQMVRRHLPDPLLPNPSDKDLDWVAGQKAAATQLEWGVDRVLVALEANSVRARQAMVVELAKALYPEMKTPDFSPQSRPKIS